MIYTSTVKKQTKITSTKILMDNQYGQAMTKPLPYGCIKKQEHPPSLTEFNRVLDKISHNDNIRHFIVDIKFNDMNPKTLFNEINPAIFEKKKKNATIWRGGWGKEL